MADDNKPFKYMRYAIGEIVLVVIGILIALQVNNWNENRNNKQKVNLLLKKIQKDIELDIETIINGISFYATQDSLITLVLNRKVTKDDYKSPNSRGLHRILYNMHTFELKNSNYNNLIQNQSIIPIEYDSLIDQLTYQYSDLIKNINYQDGNFIYNRRKFYDYLFLNHDWYSSIEPDHQNEERIDFLLNNTIYLGMVKQYRKIGIYNYLLIYHIDYLQKALDNHALINKVLNQDNNMIDLYRSFEHDSTFMGSYKSMRSGDTMRYYKINNRYYMDHPRDQHDNELIPYSKNKFVYGFGFIRFERKGDSSYFFTANYEDGKKPRAIKIK